MMLLMLLLVPAVAMSFLVLVAFFPDFLENMERDREGGEEYRGRQRRP